MLTQSFIYVMYVLLKMVEFIQELRLQDDPNAEVFRDENGMVSQVVWRCGGIPHREGNLPAVLTVAKDGYIIGQEFYREGKRHRDGDQPAVIGYHPDATRCLSIDFWRKVKGEQLSFEREPLSIRRDFENAVVLFEWYLEDQPFRQINPWTSMPMPSAQLIALKSGIALHELFLIDSAQPEEISPAEVLRDPSTGVAFLEYWYADAHGSPIGEVARHKDTGRVEYSYWETDTGIEQPRGWSRHCAME